MTNGLRIQQAESLVCTIEQHRWDWAGRHADEIDARWNEAVARQPKLFNGPVLLAHRWDIADHAEGLTFRCTFFETGYKNFMVAQRMGFPDTSVFNVFAMAALRSSDGAFLLGEMAPHTANAGQIYFPAGTPDRDDVKGSTVDLAGSVLRELEEETGLGESDVKISGACAIVIDRQQIACMQLVDLPMPADLTKRRIEASLTAQSGAELSRIHVVRTPDDIDPSRMPSHTVAYLSHMLAGR